MAGKFKFERDRLDKNLDITIHTCICIEKWRKGWKVKEEVLCELMDCKSTQLTQGWFGRVCKRINSERNKLSGDEKEFFYMKTLKERFPELCSEIQGQPQVEVLQAEIHPAKRKRTELESCPVALAEPEVKSVEERLRETSAALTRVKKNREGLKAAHRRKINELTMERLAVEQSKIELRESYQEMKDNNIKLLRDFNNLVMTHNKLEDKFRFAEDTEDYRNRQPPSTKHSKTEEDHILSTSTSEQKDSYEDCSSQAVDADDDTARITKGRSQQYSEIAKLKMELLAEIAKTDRWTALATKMQDLLTLFEMERKRIDLEFNRSDIKTDVNLEEPVKVKEEAVAFEDVAMESLEKQIEDLLHYANKHNDQNAALKILKLESLIIERDSIKWEQMDALSNCKKSKNKRVKEATGQSINNSYLQDETRL